MRKMHVILEIPEKRYAGPASCEYCFFNRKTSYPRNYPLNAVSDKRIYGGCHNINDACYRVKPLMTRFPDVFCSRFDVNDVRVKSIYLTDTDSSESQ